jgi:cytochrome c-type biogenesis protein CcmH
MPLLRNYHWGIDVFSRKKRIENHSLMRLNMWTKTKFVWLAVAFCGLTVSLTWAQPSRIEDSSPSANDTLKVVSLEEVNKIASKLMAPCCWSGTVDSHQSPAAEEIKVQIRAALQQGYTEKQILDSFVAAYGERILAKPKAVGFNLMAWILPAIAILLGGVGAWKFPRHSSQPPAKVKPAKPAPSDDPYAQRLERELEEFDK